MDEDWKTKLLQTKVAVVYLNSAADFPAWHLALRRLVQGFGMGEALMYTVPKSQAEAAEKRMKITSEKIKEEKSDAPKKEKAKEKSKFEKGDTPLFPFLLTLLMNR